MAPLTNDNFVKMEDARLLFRNRFVVFLGDSVIRAMYKDLVSLLQSNDMMVNELDLRPKGERTFKGDELLEGGDLLTEGKTNGIGYREVRQFKVDYYLVRFYFVTACHGAYMESILHDFETDVAPDIVLMNSSLWDITRYGAKSVEMFEINICRMLDRFKQVLKPTCLFIWLTTLFVSSEMRGGFMIPKIEHKKDSIRLDIVQANWFATMKCKEREFDVFDMNYRMRRWQYTEMIRDGVHWTPRGHRIITTYLCCYIADSFQEKISPNFAYSGHLPAVIIHDDPSVKTYPPEFWKKQIEQIRKIK